ncbi:hypothetical protein [Pseudomonas sp. GD03730]|uniref:hypothetical protein n=1 Tax=Pseudomonas sp. GD03730 TaxID=2975375 RepID=UPI00244B9597|nr:hypothetical protein [Pseudomonas sp. GD03730]MDH1403687.1 hypothetical protein [Pseudomonas sp. GD03730]
MPHPIQYLGHPLHTVNAKAALRRELEEAVARFGAVTPAPEFQIKPTPAQERVTRYGLHKR